MAKAKVFTPCPLHPVMEEGQKRIEDKIDTILTNQSNYALDIQHLKDTVDNGLKSSVSSMKETVNGISKQVEAFTWFSEWINQLRNNLFKNVLKLAGGTAIIWYIFNFGKQTINTILGG